MRWNDLFADLEGQLGAAADAQFSSDVADRTRGERASVALEARFAGAVGATVSVTLRDGERFSGTLTDVASTWILVSESARQSWIPLHALVALGGLGPRAVELPAVARKLSVGHALRALSRDRSEVVVCTTGGRWSGIIAQVGADYVEIRERDTRALTVLPFGVMTRVFSAGVAH
jgi:hypothetical protein